MKDYDPQMHTAEHVLNQTMIRMFGSDRSFSMHLERKKSKCDYYFDRPLKEEEERAIEEEVNRIISLNLPVKEEYKSYSEAAKIYDVSKLPETESESVRVVHVGDYDSCLCIGSHVNNTSEVGTFRLVSSSYESGVLRIRFKLNRN
jgi:alanyl-tRNA synthetase